jgi:hypothetical protein
MSKKSILTTNNIQVIESNKVEIYVSNYRSYFNKSVEGVLGMSKAVWDANQLTQEDKDEFCKQTGLIEKYSTYKKLLKIGTKYKLYFDNQNNLPANWTTLYTLTSLTNEAIESLIDKGSINSNMTGSEAKALLPESNKKPKTEEKNNEVIDPKENEDILFVKLEYRGNDLSKVKKFMEKIKEAALKFDVTCEGNKKFRTLFEDDVDLDFDMA